MFKLDRTVAGVVDVVAVDVAVLYDYIVRSYALLGMALSCVQKRTHTHTLALYSYYLKLCWHNADNIK